MLYLFGTGSWEGNLKVLKIGYTGNIEERKSQYKLHNPLGKIISVREGDEELELMLHLRLIHSKTDFLDEWFYDEEDVYKAFKESEEEIEKWLWENRGDCLLTPQLPSPGTVKDKILRKLKKKYGSNISLEGEKLL